MADLYFVREELNITMSRLGSPGPKGDKGDPVTVITVNAVSEIPATPDPNTLYVVKA